MAPAFRRGFDSAKARIGSRAFAWYPYDSLANLAHLDRLLTGENRELAQLAGSGPVLDAGCADGELAFFLESLGFEVHALDHPATNHNGMRGVEALKSALGSGVQIHCANLDSQFALPENRYGLAFFLGILYHLKNPFYVLEALSRHARYCLLSTLVADRFPGLDAGVRALPLAYLLEEAELNRDDSNYWVFSEAGLRRLLRRTNWDVCDFMIAGESERERRAFALLKSSFGLGNVGLLAGWHEAEGSGWRWTERRFSISARAAQAGRAALLEMNFFVPDALIERHGSVAVSARAGGVELAPGVYRQAGAQVYERRIPAEALAAASVVIDFSLDCSLAPQGGDLRELGVVVAGIRLGG